MNLMNEICLEKIIILTNFCIEKLALLPISKQEFYYVWRYVLAELGVLIDECGILESIRSLCRDIELNNVRSITHRILYAQYSLVTNEEVIEILSKLCQCLKLVINGVSI